jgi:hydrogenase maturation factor
VLDVDEATGLARCKTADGAGVEVETELVGPVRRGDAVLVHAGTALVLLDEECR